MRFSRVFRLPWELFWPGFDRCLSGPIRALPIMLLGLAVGWYVYVPLHELLHALACVVGGGTVGRLEIAPLYGGALYAAIFPFVEAGGEYAGRLAEFDTGGSDWTYLLTDLGPYILTLWPGVWAWRRAGRLGKPWAFGFWLSFAFAPFISLTGDAYEIGSLAVTNMPTWQDVEVLRGDDLFVVAERVSQAEPSPWAGLLVATLLGVLWSFATFALAAWIGERLTPEAQLDATRLEETAPSPEAAL